MDWRFGLCVFSERNVDGFVNLQPDWFGEGELDDGGGEALEAIHPYGFRSRPRDPTPAPDGKGRLGAGLMYVFDGDEGFGFPTQDPRDATLLEDEGKGGAQVYAVSDAGTVSRLFMLGTTGDITIQRSTTAKIALSSTGTDVTGSSPATQNVALYSPIQPFLDAVKDLLGAIVGDPTALPPVPGLMTLFAALPGGTILASNLVDKLATLNTTALVALDSSLASSSALRASTS